VTSRSSRVRRARRSSDGPFKAPRRRCGSLAFVTVAAVALVAAPVAAGHGTLTPSTAAAGASQRFELTVPNDRLDADIVGVALALPAGAALESAEAEQPRWAVTSTETSVRWTGGPIERTTTETFAFVARVPTESGPVQFTLLETYDDGDAAPFPMTVVTSGPAGAGDGGDDVVATIALVLAALALTVATIALALALRTRGSRPAA
jgi:uncharacterized protein YcnI